MKRTRGEDKVPSLATLASKAQLPKVCMSTLIQTVYENTYLYYVYDPRSESFDETDLRYFDKIMAFSSQELLTKLATDPDVWQRLFPLTDELEGTWITCSGFHSPYRESIKQLWQSVDNSDFVRGQKMINVFDVPTLCDMLIRIQHGILLFRLSDFADMRFLRTCNHGRAFATCFMECAIQLVTRDEYMENTCYRRKSSGNPRSDEESM